FNLLSDILLEEIFLFISPEKLIELRLLNKVICNIINNIIRVNLIYSKYNHNTFRQYQQYQLKFIKENGSIMRHLNINSNEIEYINYCPNIISLYYEHLSNNSSIKEIKMELPKLKRIIIKSSDISSTQYLDLFRNYLFQIEIIEMYGHNGDIQSIVNYLNPNILKSFIFHSSSRDLYLNGMEAIKHSFSKLSFLQLKSKNYIITPCEFDSSINFTSPLNLDIEGLLDIDFNIDYFGTLDRLKSVKLKDKLGTFFEVGSNYSKLIRVSNLITLGHFDFIKPTTYDLIKLPTLNQIYIKELSKKSLKSIASLPNIQTIYFDKLDFSIEDTFKKYNINGKNIYVKKYYQHISSKRNLFKCKFIKQVTISYLSTTMEDFLCFLSFFPNLEVIKIKKWNLANKYIGVSYKITSPLLLIAPTGPHMDIMCYKKLEQIAMLNWMKLS
ncbi:hypothetical protein K502DRAFT_231304, partial [Neoconidiobolus thromboides FSU 785]